MSKPCWILVFLLNFHQYRSQVMEGRANWPSLPEEEIEGGEIAEPNAFPFMVSIHKTSGKKTWHSCGGTIINKNSILTAGHCVWDKKKDEPLSEDVFTVVVGTNDIKHVENNLKIGVKKVFVHPAYSNIVQENDIAVLKTSKNIEFSLTTSSVTLAEKAMYVDSEPAAYFSNIMCVAPGWGLIVDNLSYATSLMFQVDMVVLSNNQCTVSVEQALKRNFAPNFELCSFREAQKVCQGDSGGPLLCEGIQVAVVSWGHGCAHKGASVLTRVDAYKDWILNPYMKEKAEDSTDHQLDVHAERNQGISGLERSLRSFGPVFMLYFVVAIRNIL